MKQTILVTGVTGTVGQEVVKELLKKNVQLRVGVRDLGKIKNEPWRNQVEAIVIDYDQPETVKHALAKVNKLFLVTPPATYRDKEVAEMILEQGRKSGLQHIVRLSGMGADLHNLFANHQAADTLLLESEIDFTALQPNIFMQNFYNYLVSIKQDGKIIEPAGNGKASFIDSRDIAAVAAVVLTEPGHANKIYELTGGESLDYYQAAKLFTDITGRKIVYQPVSSEEYIQAKAIDGMPAEFAKSSMEFFQMVQNGDYARVSPAVEKILGRKPITLKQFITDYRDKFIA